MVGMSRYSRAFKNKLVQQMLIPGGPSVTRLAQEAGVPQQTLSRWRKEAVSIDAMSKKKRSRDKSPHQLPAEKKLELLREAEGLSEEELGVFLRSRGLHKADLDAWRASILRALSGPAGRPGKSADALRAIELEKELRRKEKALAEAAALLMLKKKAAALWGDEDDDTALPSDEQF